MPSPMLNRVKARLSGAPAPRGTRDFPPPFPRPEGPAADVPDSQWDVLDAKLIEIAGLPGIEIGLLFRIADTVDWTSTGWTVDGIPVVTWARNALSKES